MNTFTRRYDIDWIRVIAIGLLLLYHVAIGFQPWGIMVGFITARTPWNALWTPMEMLNIWRIPILFFVSGMGVYFAMQNRNWKQLLRERALRILLPYVFGSICIFPISVYIWSRYNNFSLPYSANPGHLWFLGNIFVYVVVLLPVFFYLKNNENGKIASIIRKMLSTPLGLVPVVAALILEAMIVNPNPYTLYAATWHGFVLGFIAFFFGFCFVVAGEPFWKMLLLWRWFFLIAATALFSYRLAQVQMTEPYWILVAESNCWIFSIFAFGYKYLNQPSRALTYLTQAVLPIYILHMIFLFLASSVIFPLNIDIRIQFLIVLIITCVGCFGSYELIRKVNFLRPLFGLKMDSTSCQIPSIGLTQTIQKKSGISLREKI